MRRASEATANQVRRQSTGRSAVDRDQPVAGRDADTRGRRASQYFSDFHIISDHLRVDTDPDQLAFGIVIELLERFLIEIAGERTKRSNPGRDPLVAHRA